MKLLVQKILYLLFTLFLAVSAVFFSVRLSPGDPVERILGPEASQQQVENFRVQLGLDTPAGTQFINYVKGIFRGDLGTSLYGQQDVLELLLTHMAPTLWLAFFAVSLSFLIGTYFGVSSAINKSGVEDNIIRVVSLLFLSFPIFSLAPILVLLFAIKIPLYPVSGWGGINYMALPILTLVLPLSSVIARVTRNKYLEERHAPWVNVLRAKGMGQLGVELRITKVCMPTILNVVAIQLSVVLAGTMITELIFDIPGLGTLLFSAIQDRDYPVVQGAILYSTLIYMTVYFLFDYINEILDPRLRNSTSL